MKVFFLCEKKIIGIDLGFTKNIRYLLETTCYEKL